MLDLTPPTLTAASFATATSRLTLSFDRPMAAPVTPPPGSLEANTSGTYHTAWTFFDQPSETQLSFTSASSGGVPPIPSDTGRWTQPGGSIRSTTGADWPSLATFGITVI